MEKITTRTIEAFIDDSEILRVAIFENATIDLDDAVDNFLVLKNLSGDRPRLRLVNAAVNWKITKEARDYALSENTPQKIIARAIIVKSIFNKIAANFFYFIYKVKIPHKCFLKEDKALAWLNTFRRN